MKRQEHNHEITKLKKTRKLILGFILSLAPLAL
jgi:hypothetical protein